MKAVFLDRDGVLNKATIKNGRPYPPRNVGEVQILSGVLEALENLRAIGFKLIVITNQPDVARGSVTLKSVEKINAHLNKFLPLDDIFCCFHDDLDNCNCRKPKPGGLLAAARKYDIDLDKSYMVGDRWRDIEAGSSAGCKTIFLDYGYAEKQPDNLDFRVRSLLEAYKIIKGEKSEES